MFTYVVVHQKSILKPTIEECQIILIHVYDFKMGVF